jgi:hypothetical protein
MAECLLSGFSVNMKGKEYLQYLTRIPTRKNNSKDLVSDQGMKLKGKGEATELLFREWKHLCRTIRDFVKFILR